MVAAVRIHKIGGPEVLTYDDITLKDPGQGEVRIKHSAIGLNFIDVYFRTGLYPAVGGLPMIPGNEGSGVVTAVGPDVSDLKVGDRVAYGTAPGGYAAERNILAEKLVKVPDSIDDKTAAGMMLKGLTAQYLLRRTFKVEKGQTVLVHAAAGGVGLILCQWANHLGATVIGTVGSADKAKLARDNGAHHTILYRDEDFVARVGEITKGEKCHVVYDGVG
jgi:NADPH2:quinone reductase